MRIITFILPDSLSVHQPKISFLRHLIHYSTDPKCEVSMESGGIDHLWNLSVEASTVPDLLPVHQTNISLLQRLVRSHSNSECEVSFEIDDDDDDDYM